MDKKRRITITGLFLTIVLALIVMFLIQAAVEDFAIGFADGLNSGGIVVDPGFVVNMIKFPVWMVFGVIVALVIYFRVIRPVRKISKSMERVRSGDLEEQIKTLDGMEFGIIENSFNSMIESLKRARELENSSNEKNRKLYAEIAHDLKTPMTMILGYARLIKEGDLDPDTRESYLDTIIEQTGNANALLEDMLEYAKLGSTEYSLSKEEGDIAELLRQVTADNYICFEQKKIDIEADIPQSPVGFVFDAAQMKRVFSNLLGNAAKHNPEGIKVTVSLEDKRASGEGIKILISDNGPLLDESLKAELFEPFKTGDDSRKTGKGSGLGLSVAKKIVLLHGGSLEYSETEIPGFKSFVMVLA